jgi:excisionase family DNA binding protein
VTPQLTFFTIPEVAKILRLSEDTVRRYAKAGKIPCRRFGRKTVFSESDLLSYSDSCRVEQEAPPARAQGRVVAGELKSDEYYLSLRRKQ